MSTELLASIQANAPQVLELLNPSILEHLSADPTLSYKDDEAFLRAYRAYFSLCSFL